MNKFLAKTLTITLLLMMICTTAFAASISATKAEDGKIVVSVTGLTAGEESTLLAVDTGTDLSTVADNTGAIRYIDQITATDGTAAYTFDAGDAKNVTIYSGYSSMPSGTDPLQAVVQEGGDEPNPPAPGGDFIYGDVDGNKTVNLLDAGEIISYHFDPTVTFTDEKYGLKAADVDANGTVNLLDAGYVINKHFYPAETVFPADETK